MHILCMRLWHLQTKSLTSKFLSDKSLAVRRFHHKRPLFNLNRNLNDLGEKFFIMKLKFTFNKSGSIHDLK